MKKLLFLLLPFLFLELNAQISVGAFYSGNKFNYPEFAGGSYNIFMNGAGFTLNYRPLKWQEKTKRPVFTFSTGAWGTDRMPTYSFVGDYISANLYIADGEVKTKAYSFIFGAKKYFLGNYLSANKFLLYGLLNVGCFTQHTKINYYISELTTIPLPSSFDTEENYFKNKFQFGGGIGAEINLFKKLNVFSEIEYYKIVNQKSTRYAEINLFSSTQFQVGIKYNFMKIK